MFENSIEDSKTESSLMRATIAVSLITLFLSIATLVILEFFGVFKGNLKWDEYGISFDQAGQIISLLITAIIIGFAISIVLGISFVIAKKRRKVTHHKVDKSESDSMSDTVETESPEENENVQETNSEISAINEKILAANTQKDLALSELTQIRSQIESARTKMSDLSSQIDEAKSELESLRIQYSQKDVMISELRQTKTEIESSQTKLSELNSQIENAKMELDSLQTQYSKKEEDLNSQIKNAKAELESIKIQHAQKDALMSELTKMRSQIESAKTKLADLNLQITEAKEDLNSLHMQYIRRQEDIKLAKKELEFIRSEILSISQKVYPAAKSNKVLDSETKGDIKRMEKRRSEFFSYLAQRQ